MDRRERADLDRHITGNWGEDQFPEEYDRGTGCIDGMKCPNCGEHRSFQIAIEAWTDVTPKGSKGIVPVVADLCEWGDNSKCRCPMCGFSALIKDFKPQQERE
jgi:hypothetical protein